MMEKSLTEGVYRTDSAVGGIQWRWRLLVFARGPSKHIAARREVESTGVGRKGDEPMRDSLGELVKSLAFSASMAADLALIKDQ
jgi:hypothetical protein